MDQTPPPRLPARLDGAAHRVRLAARAAAEQTVDSLGLAALSTHGVLQRDALLGAQYELNRKLALFGLAFNEALDTDIARQLGTLVAVPTPASAPCPTPDQLVANWESLSLVDDHEVELHLSADRFAREIGNACEWEIRELDAYVASLLHFGGGQHERNPLRAEVIGQALVRAVEAVAERPEVRKVLCTEIGRTLSQMLRPVYAAIIDDFRGAGIKPRGLTVRHTPARPSAHGALHPAPAGSLSGMPDEFTPAGGPVETPLARLGSLGSFGSHVAATATTVAAHPRSGFGATARGSLHGSAGLGQVDVAMMALIRRLSALSHAPAWPRPDDHDDEDDGTGAAAPAAAPNLILAHRDALRQAATGALDHMVIDVVAGLFDQILADAAVPPQIARLIARLQLPVLRAALGDSSFFSSRRHPVRRFVNRIASLGSAVEDFDAPDGKALLERVAALVDELVGGDFEQLALYEQKLGALEDFVGAQARERLKAAGDADRVLAHKEQELRVQQHYAQRLDGALGEVPLQDYLRRFITTTWSRVIAAAEPEGGDGAQRLRDTARELVLSVCPKGTPALRQAFLQRLPQLMKDLNQGLDRIACPDEERREFFGRLLPAHAESLKGQPLSTLEMNLLSRQIETALAVPVPAAADLPPAAATDPAALQALAGAAAFTPAEAQAVGLVDERSVDWNGGVDIDLDLAAAGPEITAVDIDIAGLPTPEPVEPMRGKSLADHVQIGFAYRMHLEGRWQTVRLTHVSAARGFFVFSHGAKQQRALSLTYRMLSRLCEAQRFRAVENAYLLERATARARRQLAALMLPARGRR